MEILILSLCAIMTSIVSAIAGMGGGVLLLSAMTFVLPYHLIIPIHGVVQFISNLSRSYYLRKNVKWDFFLYFLFGAPIGFIFAYMILSKITNPNIYYLLLACFIFYTLFKPKKLPSFKLEGYQWGILGIFSGLIGSILGATGPLIAPFYIRDDLTKEQIISTKALQQVVTHFLKIPLFLSLDFEYAAHFPLIISMCLCALIGTFSGIKILGKIDESVFVKIFKTVLFISAIRLVYKFLVSVI